ncbi:MAG: AAA family ATPase [Candidatus Omnitrophota bacterium]
MNKIKHKICFKLIAVILINAFLCLDIAWAAGGNLRGLTTHLAPAINLDSAEDMEVFNRLCGNTGDITKKHTTKIRLSFHGAICAFVSEKKDLGKQPIEKEIIITGGITLNELLALLEKDNPGITHVILDRMLSGEIIFKINERIVQDLSFFIEEAADVSVTVMPNPNTQLGETERLDEAQMAKYTAIKNIVNPQGVSRRVLYANSGADASSILVATDFDRALFVDVLPLLWELQAIGARNISIQIVPRVWQWSKNIAGNIKIFLNNYKSRIEVTISGLRSGFKQQSRINQLAIVVGSILGLALFISGNPIGMIPVVMLPCDRMFYGEELRKQKAQELKNKELSEEEVEAHAERTVAQVEEMGELLDEFSEELGEDEDLETDVDNDQTKHDIRDITIQSLTRYLKSGKKDKSFEEFVNSLIGDLQTTLSDDNEEAIRAALNKPGVRDKLRAAYNKGEEDLPAIAGEDTNGPGHDTRTIRYLNELLHRAIHQRGWSDQHHHLGGTHLHSLAWLLLGFGILRVVLNLAFGVDMPVDNLVEGIAVALVMGQGGVGLPGFEEGSEEDYIREYTIDLNELARAGKIDDTYYLERDAGNINNQIAVRGRNNVVIVGDPEVGEGLLEAIVVRSEQEVTTLTNLQGAKFLEFNTARFVDKLAMPGQLEEEVAKLINSIKNVYWREQVVLVFNFQDFYSIGEIKGKMIGGLYLLLEAALNAENISVLGIANKQVYAGLFENDRRLESKFEKCELTSPAPYDMRRIMRQFRLRVTDIYAGIFPEGVSLNISRRTIDDAIKLAEKYYPSGTPPNKLQEIIDKIITDKLLRLERLNSELIDHEEKLLKAAEGLKRALLGGEQAEVDFFKEVIDRKLSEYEAITNQIEEHDRFINRIKEQGKWEITLDDIVEQIAEDSGVPLYIITTTEDEKLANYVESIQGMLIGQDPAITATYDAFSLRQIRGVRENQPIGVFIFVGPTGVGKTELSKSIARHMFGNEEAMARFDMSEYMNRMDHYKLIGAPPGYIGYEAGGQLTDHVLRRPYSVILFDEIEKAYPDVFDLFLSILNDGILEDNHGRAVNFKNTIIIMTSNLGFSQTASADRAEEARVKEIIEDLQQLKEDINKLTDEQLKGDLLKSRNHIYKLIEHIGHDKEEAHYLAESAAEIQAVLDVEDEGEMRIFLLQKIEQKISNWQNYNGLDIVSLYKVLAEVKQVRTDEQENRELRALVERELKARRAIVQLQLERMQEESGIEFDNLLNRFKTLDDMVSSEDMEAQREYLLEDIRGAIRRKLEQSVRNEFRPEFIGRIGLEKIITFEPLSKESLEKILEIKIREYEGLLGEAGYRGLELSEELREEVIRQGYDVVNGARPMIRALKRIVLAPLSAAILGDKFEKGDKIFADIEEGRVMFDTVKDEGEKRLYEHEEVISRLEENFFQGGEFDEGLVRSLLNLPEIAETKEIEGTAEGAETEELVEVVEPAEAGEEREEALEEFRKRFMITLPRPEDLDEEMEELDQAEIEQRIGELDKRIQGYQVNIRKYERDLGSATRDGEKQAINLEISNERRLIETAEQNKQTYELRKQGRNKEAEQAFAAAKQAQIEKIEQAEKEINEMFEHLTIRSAEGLVEDIHPPLDPVVDISRIVKQKRRNYPFILSESLLMQKSIVDSFAKRAREGDIAGFENTRILRLRLGSLRNYFSLIGYFEARLKEVVDAIEEDGKEKGLNTIIVMDFDDVKEELRRLRVNPFLLGFFLRMFKGLTTISFIMTTSRNNIAAEEYFDKYFSLVEVGELEREDIFETFTLFMRETIERNYNDGEGEAIEISFAAIDMAVRLWERYFAGQPSLETLNDWFNGLFVNKQQSKNRIQGKIFEIMGNLRFELEELIDNSEGDLTVEDLQNNEEIIGFIRELEELKEEFAKPSLPIIEGRDTLSYVEEKERKENVVEIDVGLMEGSEKEKILKLDQILKARIVGQEEAIEAICNAVKIAKGGLKPRHQPIGSFIFAGPTGVGKTQLAKTLAEILGMNLKIINMSEYKTREDLSKLIGAPPGFVGYDENGGEGALIEQLKDYPNTVIVFDEIDKGDKQILDILLQILEDGRVTSNQGRTVSLKDAVIVLTSNIGMEGKVEIWGEVLTVYSLYPEMDDVIKSRDPERIAAFKEKMTEMVKESFKGFFRPEFLNRIDAQVIFNPLTHELLQAVVEIFLNVEIGLFEARQRINIEIGENKEEKEAVYGLLVEKGYQAEYGARPLGRAVERLFSKPLIEFRQKQWREINEGDTIIVKRAGERMVFEVRAKQEQEEDGIALSAYEQVLLAHMVEELNRREGEELTLIDMQEILDPRPEAKPQEGKDIEFSRLDRYTTTNNNFQRRDRETSTKIQEIDDNLGEELRVPITGEEERTLTSAEAEEYTERLQGLVREWVSEAVRVAKMANVESFIWEQDKRHIERFDNLRAAELREQIEQYLELMGEDKGVSIEWGWQEQEGEPVFVIGVRYTSKLTRKIQRAIFEQEFSDEEEMRGKTERSLQGILKAKMELEALGGEMNFSQDEEGAMFWIAVPAKVFEPEPVIPEPAVEFRDVPEIKTDDPQLQALFDQISSSGEQPALSAARKLDNLVQSGGIDAQTAKENIFNILALARETPYNSVRSLLLITAGRINPNPTGEELIVYLQMLGVTDIDSLRTLSLSRLLPLSKLVRDYIAGDDDLRDSLREELNDRLRILRGKAKTLPEDQRDKPGNIIYYEDASVDWPGNKRVGITMRDRTGERIEIKRVIDGRFVDSSGNRRMQEFFTEPTIPLESLDELEKEVLEILNRADQALRSIDLENDKEVDALLENSDRSGIIYEALEILEGSGVLNDILVWYSKGRTETREQIPLDKGDILIRPPSTGPDSIGIIESIEDTRNIKVALLKKGHSEEVYDWYQRGYRTKEVRKLMEDLLQFYSPVSEPAQVTDVSELIDEAIVFLENRRWSYKANRAPFRVKVFKEDDRRFPHLLERVSDQDERIIEISVPLTFNDPVELLLLFDSVGPGEVEVIERKIAEFRQRMIEAQPPASLKERLEELVTADMPSFEELEKQLNEAENRFAALIKMEFVRQKQQAAQVLLNELNKNMDEESWILSALDELISQGVSIELPGMEELKRDLMDNDWRVRRFAIYQLRFVKEKQEAADALWNRLNEEGEATNYLSILNTLAYLRNQGAEIKVPSLDQLKDLLNSRNILDRCFAAVQLGFVKGDKQIEAVQILMNGMFNAMEDEIVRNAIRESLIYLKQQGVNIKVPDLDELRKNLIDYKWNIRVFAAVQFGFVENEQEAAVQVLVKALSNQSRNIIGEIISDALSLLRQQGVKIKLTSSLDELKSDLNNNADISERLSAAVQLRFVEEGKYLQAAEILLERLKNLPRTLETPSGENRLEMLAIRDSLRYVFSQIGQQEQEMTFQALGATKAVWKLLTAETWKETKPAVAGLSVPEDTKVAAGLAEILRMSLDLVKPADDAEKGEDTDISAEPEFYSQQEAEEWVQDNLRIQINTRDSTTSVEEAKSIAIKIIQNISKETRIFDYMMFITREEKDFECKIKAGGGYTTIDHCVARTLELAVIKGLADISPYKIIKWDEYQLTRPIRKIRWEDEASEIFKDRIYSWDFILRTRLEQYWQEKYLGVQSEALTDEQRTFFEKYFNYKSVSEPEQAVELMPGDSVVLGNGKRYVILSNQNTSYTVQVPRYAYMLGIVAREVETERIVILVQKEESEEMPADLETYFFNESYVHASLIEIDEVNNIGIYQFLKDESQINIIPDSTTTLRLRGASYTNTVYVQEVQRQLREFKAYIERVVVNKQGERDLESEKEIAARLEQLRPEGKEIGYTTIGSYGAIRRMLNVGDIILPKDFNAPLMVGLGIIEEIHDDYRFSIMMIGGKRVSAGPWQTEAYLPWPEIDNIPIPLPQQDSTEPVSVMEEEPTPALTAMPDDLRKQVAEIYVQIVEVNARGMDVELLSTIPAPLNKLEQGGKYIGIDGKQLILANTTNRIELYDITNPENPQLKDRPGGNRSIRPSSVYWDIACSEDEILLVLGRTSYFYQALYRISESGELQRLYFNRSEYSDKASIRSLFSKDRTLMVSITRNTSDASDYHTVRLQDITNPSQPKDLSSLFNRPGPTGRNWLEYEDGLPNMPVLSLALSEDNNLLVLGFDRYIIYFDITDPKNPKRVAMLERSSPAMDLSMSSDKTLLAVGMDNGKIEIRDISRDKEDSGNSQPLAVIDKSIGGHSAAITSLIISSNKNLLISGSMDGNIRFWDIRDPKRPKLIGLKDTTNEGHTSPIFSLALSPDENMLVSTDQEGNTKLWGLAAIKEHFLKQQVQLMTENDDIATSPISQETKDKFYRLLGTDEQTLTAKASGISDDELRIYLEALIRLYDTGYLNWEILTKGWTGNFNHEYTLTDPASFMGELAYLSEFLEMADEWFDRAYDIVTSDEFIGEAFRKFSVIAQIVKECAKHPALRDKVLEIINNPKTYGINSFDEATEEILTFRANDILYFALQLARDETKVSEVETLLEEFIQCLNMMQDKKMFGINDRRIGDELGFINDNMLGKILAVAQGIDIEKVRRVFIFAIAHELIKRGKINEGFKIIEERGGIVSYWLNTDIFEILFKDEKYIGQSMKMIDGMSDLWDPKNTASLALLLSNMARGLARNKQLDWAARLLQSAYDRAKEIDDPSQRLSRYMGYIVPLMREYGLEISGKSREAILEESLEQAKTVLENAQPGDQISRTLILNIIAVIKERALDGEYARVISCIDVLTANREKIRGSFYDAINDAYGNAAEAAAARGDYDKAVELAGRMRRESDTQYKLLDLAVIMAERGDFDAALTLARTLQSLKYSFSRTMIRIANKMLEDEARRNAAADILVEAANAGLDFINLEKIISLAEEYTEVSEKLLQIFSIILPSMREAVNSFRPILAAIRKRNPDFRFQLLPIGSTPVLGVLELKELAGVESAI